MGELQRLSILLIRKVIRIKKLQKQTRSTFLSLGKKTVEKIANGIFYKNNKSQNNLTDRVKIMSLVLHNPKYLFHQ